MARSSGFTAPKPTRAPAGPSFKPGFNPQPSSTKPLGINVGMSPAPRVVSNVAGSPPKAPGGQSR